MKTFNSRKPCILLIALSLISTIAFADTYYWCQNEQTCGTTQSATLANGCLGIICPKSQICQGKESNDGNSCSQSYYMAQCTGMQYTTDPVTGTCIPPGTPAGPEPGGAACASCSIN